MSTAVTPRLWPANEPVRQRQSVTKKPVADAVMLPAHSSARVQPFIRALGQAVGSVLDPDPSSIWTALALAPLPTLRTNF